MLPARSCRPTRRRSTASAVTVVPARLAVPRAIRPSPSSASVTLCSPAAAPGATLRASVTGVVTAGTPVTAVVPFTSKVRPSIRTSSVPSLMPMPATSGGRLAAVSAAVALTATSAARRPALIGRRSSACTRLCPPRSLRRDAERRHELERRPVDERQHVGAGAAHVGRDLGPRRIDGEIHDELPTLDPTRPDLARPHVDRELRRRQARRSRGGADGIERRQIVGRDAVEVAADVVAVGSGGTGQAELHAATPQHARAHVRDQPRAHRRREIRRPEPRERRHRERIDRPVERERRRRAEDHGRLRLDPRRAHHRRDPRKAQRLDVRIVAARRLQVGERERRPRIPRRHELAGGARQREIDRPELPLIGEHRRQPRPGSAGSAHPRTGGTRALEMERRAERHRRDARRAATAGARRSASSSLPPAR